jgi:hypothetical protein
VLPMVLAAPSAALTSKSRHDASDRHFFGDFFRSVGPHLPLNAGPGVLASQVPLIQWARAAGSASRQPRRGLIQTGFPSRVFAMRRSSPFELPEQP